LAATICSRATGVDGDLVRVAGGGDRRDRGVAAQLDAGGSAALDEDFHQVGVEAPHRGRS
jgi:hypothetical protein